MIWTKSNQHPKCIVGSFQIGKLPIHVALKPKGRGESAQYYAGVMLIDAPFQNRFHNRREAKTEIERWAAHASLALSDVREAIERSIKAEKEQAEESQREANEALEWVEAHNINVDTLTTCLEATK